MLERDLVRGFVDPGQKALIVSVSSHLKKWAPQLIDGRRLDEESQGGTGILLPDMNGALHLDIQQWGFSGIPDPFQLAFQGAVKFPFVDHFPFRKFVLLDLLFKGLQTKKIVVDSIGFIRAGCTGGSRHGKCNAGGIFIQQEPGNGGLSISREPL